MHFRYWIDTALNIEQRRRSSRRPSYGRVIQAYGDFFDSSPWMARLVKAQLACQNRVSMFGYRNLCGSKHRVEPLLPDLAGRVFQSRSKKKTIFA